MFFKKIILSVFSFLLLFTFVLLCSSNSFAKTYKNYTYKILDKKNKTAALTRIKKPKAKLVIPSKINGYTIVQLGERVYDKYDLDDCKLRNSKDLLSDSDRRRVITEIKIPNTVKAIGFAAFSWCEKLKKVTLPEGLEIISCYAFCCCKSLENVTLPKSLKSIGVEGFGTCDSLSKIVIKSKDLRIGEYAFGATNSVVKSPIKSVQIRKSVRKLDINYRGIPFPKNFKLTLPAFVQKFALEQQVYPLKKLVVKGKNTTLKGSYRMDTTTKNYFMATAVYTPKNSKAWKYCKSAWSPTLKSCLEMTKDGSLEGDEVYCEASVKMKKIILKNL